MTYRMGVLHAYDQVDYDRYFVRSNRKNARRRIRIKSCWGVHDLDPTCIMGA